jgi:DNA-binding protein H-NS
MKEVNKLSRKELMEKMAALQSELDERTAEEIATAKVEILKLIAEYGLTAEDIFPSVSSDSSVKTRKIKSEPNEVKTVNKVEPIWIDPVSGKTWTGRGREPTWIQGQDRDLFLIKKPTVTAPLV